MRLESNLRVVKEYKNRFVWLVLAVFLVFAVLITRLAYLQLINGEHYYELSEHNFVQQRIIHTLRGRILDRERRILADNRPAYNVMLTPAFVKDIDSILLKLEGFLNLSERQSLRVMHLFEKARGIKRFREILLKADITRDQLALLESHKLKLEGISIRPGPVRQYNYSDLFSHVIGYVGRINERELKSKTGYFPNDQIGKMGLEKLFESQLKGKHGLEKVIVDAKGRIKSKKVSGILLNNEKSIDPVVGQNLLLSLDLDMQKAAEKNFKGRAGSMLVMDVNTGFILSWLSKPGFDPNKFIGGISHIDWATYRNSILDPLMDKVVQSAYFPGSIYKVVPAIAALESEESEIDENSHTTCHGSKKIGKRHFHCWNRGGHGQVNLHKAIRESCDVYFYWIAETLGFDPIRQYAAKFGIGQKTGISINNETAGILPSVKWHEKTHGRRWFTGDTLSHCIGQGDLKTSPIQIAVLYASIANGGKILVPQVVSQIESPEKELLVSFKPKIKAQLDISDKTLQAIRDGLFAVVNEKKGTAHSSRLIEPQFSGKTGTAQVVRLPKNKRAHDDYLLKDHAWFVAYAPAEKPEIVVVAMIEHGEHGSWVAPMVREVIAAWYKKYKQKEATRPPYTWNSPLMD